MEEIQMIMLWKANIISHFNQSQIDSDFNHFKTVLFPLTKYVSVVAAFSCVSRYFQDFALLLSDDYISK